jgi:thymidylate kinase
MQRVSESRGWEDGFAFSLIIYSRLEKAIYSESLIPEDALAVANQTIERSYWLKKALQRTMNRDDFQFPFKVSFLLGKLFYYRKLLTYPKRNLHTRVYSVVATLAAGIKLKLGIRGQRGMLISLSGIDGSGKSSATQVLLNAFATSDILAFPYWIRFGSVEWLRRNKPVLAINKLEVSISGTTTALERRQSRLKNPFLRMTWLLLNLAYLILFYNLKVRVSTWFGYVVICDRYIYDALVEIEASLPNNSSLIRLSEFLLTHLCPKPQLAWLFDLAPGEALSRQMYEQSNLAAQKELTFQRERYLALQERYQLILVNNQGNKNEVIDMVVLKTLRRYFADYHTWINGLLFSNPNQMNPVRTGR